VLRVRGCLSMRSRSLFTGVSLAAGVLVAVSPGRAADPTTGDCLNANEASIKLRSEHKLREARAQLLICSAASCPTDVREACMRQVARVSDAMPTVVFEVRTAQGQALTDVKVTMDGETIATRLEGTAVSVDPGQHQFTFEAAGMAAVQKTLVIYEGEKDHHESVVMGGHDRATSAPAPASALPAPVPSASPSEAPSGSTSRGVSPDAVPTSGSTQRTWGLIIGGVGVAGLAAGTVFGLMAANSWSTAKSECQPEGEQNCPQNAKNDRSTALTWATASTVSFIAGGVLAAGGAVLYFTAPKDAGTSFGIGLTVGPGQIGVRGTF
jgi:hypothetical protein